VSCNNDCIFVFLSNENQKRCSMALVHSRIERVFYLTSESNRRGECTHESESDSELKPKPLEPIPRVGGGLGGMLKVHTHPSLNHRFQVFYLSSI
jgi:tRNA(Arg) A34 adenosine deaminase TadA